MANDSLTQELHRAKQEAAQYKDSYRKVQTDAENMLQIMESLEKDNDRFKAQEASVTEQSRQSEERVEEALTQRDNAQRKETSTRRWVGVPEFFRS